MLGYRDRQTRALRWEAPDEDLTYDPNELDRRVVAKDQIRTIIRTFRDRLPVDIFPGRKEVPKTLISFLTMPPDWVCEIVSPGTARLDRVVKLPVYAGAGVGHAWLVDPEARTLEVLRLETGRWVLATQHADQELVRAAPFAAAEIDLARWWLPEA